MADQAGGNPTILTDFREDDSSNEWPRALITGSPGKMVGTSDLLLEQGTRSTG
jgi:hypothetical protein